jgi:hypothetical protein
MTECLAKCYAYLIDVPKLVSIFLALLGCLSQFSSTPVTKKHELRQGIMDILNEHIKNQCKMVRW